MRLRFQKGDLIAIALPLLLAVIVFAAVLPGKERGVDIAEIYQNGQLIRRISLEEDQEFTYTGDYSNAITVRDGKIAITKSDCPGEDCVHSGWIDASGRSIVCLPNRLEIRILSDENDVDFVVK